MPGLEEVLYMVLGGCLLLIGQFAVGEIRYQQWQRQLDDQQAWSARVGAAAWTAIRQYSRPGYRWREPTPKENP